MKQEGNVFEIATDDYLAGDNVRSLCVVRQTFENGSTLALLTETLTIDVGANGYFDFMYTGDGEINITSSDTTIFSINNRTVTALKAGTAVLTISDGTQIKTMNVTVNAFGGPSEDTEEPEDPEDPEEPEDPEDPVNPEEPQDSEEPAGNIDNGTRDSIKWLTYVAFAMVFLLLAGGTTIWILIKKGKFKIKK